MAPDAKVMVYDFDDSAGALNVPDDCYERLFPPAYDAGARISSHSWGSTFGTYSAWARDFDEFMYDFDDMVVSSLRATTAPSVTKASDLLARRRT